MPPNSRQKSYQGPTLAQIKAAKKIAQSAAKAFEKQWYQLQSTCSDQDSQQRLIWLRNQFNRGQRGAMESAQAEIDIATFLGGAGFLLSFVKETETRTADLECYLDHDRLFVEVTAIIPSDLDRSKAVGLQQRIRLNEEKDDFWNDGLVKRMLARMNEKAEQLLDYCAPVLMALTLVHQEPTTTGNGSIKSRKMVLDLQQLGGILSNALTTIPQISGVLLTLWNMVPAESRSNIRLTNVHVGEWVSDGKGSSRVRCLILNPVASYQMESRATDAIQRVL